MEVNISWLFTLVFVTTILALQFYPAVIPADSPYRDDRLVHWIMALSSGLIFFASILVHEFAHSVIALRYGIPVKSITLFIFGGVAQIGGEAKRPRHEFLMAIIGPLTSLLLAVIFFGLWWVVGGDGPITIMLEWLFLMNLIIAAFNMAPGFPMDGGRVLRSIIWGITGNLFRATRLATLAGRSMGYSLMIIGALALTNFFSFINPLGGAWFILLGWFLESSARQAWFQTRAMETLGKVTARDLMTADLPTADTAISLAYLTNRGTEHYIFFVADEDERVVGVITDKEVAAMTPDLRRSATAGQAMVSTRDVPITAPEETGAALLQRMEEESLWYLPVVSEGQVIGVVSKDSLLQLLAQSFTPRRRDLAGHGTGRG